MAEIESLSKTASTTLDFKDSRTIWHRFCEDGDEDKEKTWKLKLEHWHPDEFDGYPDADFSGTKVKIKHSSTANIYVEEILWTFDEGSPQDLLVRDTAAYAQLVLETDYCQLPGTIFFSSAPQHRSDMTKLIYKAKLKNPDSFDRIAIQIKYRTTVDQIKERIARDYRELLHSAENADCILSFRDGQLKAHKVTKCFRTTRK